MSNFQSLMFSLLLLVHFCESSSFNTIKVLIPKIEPLSSYSNGIFNKLGIKIIENFAVKFNLSAQYVTINQTLQQLFENEKNFENTSQT